MGQITMQEVYKNLHITMAAAETGNVPQQPPCSYASRCSVPQNLNPLSAPIFGLQPQLG